MSTDISTTTQPGLSTTEVVLGAVLAVAAVGIGAAYWYSQDKKRSGARDADPSNGRILIKGKDVKFQMTDGRWIVAPADYGMIHDPDGKRLDRCFVYVGPFKNSGESVALTNDAETYFGSKSHGLKAVVDVPKGPWTPLGQATQILYRRPGKFKGKYFHFFDKKTTVLISRCRNHFRIELQNGCIVNWRGFVYP